MDQQREMQVIEVIEKIRPYIQRDGGDVEFVSLLDGIVTVRMHGACIGCHALDITLTYGIESMLKEEVEGIERVIVETDDLYSAFY